MDRQSDLGFMAERLARWASAHLGAAAVVGGVERLPGHSSVTIGFDVSHPSGVERLVLRVVPEGVPRQGSTDVLRQVPLLRVVERAGVPVPRLRWSDEDPEWFGVEYLIVDRVPGATPGDVFADGGAPPPAGDPEAMFGQAVEALAAIHRAPWRPALEGWAQPLSLEAEIDRWVPLLERAGDPAVLGRDTVAAGLRVRDRLQATRPGDPEPGLVHGDFYSNNWMFDGGRLTGVLDWETAFIGPRLLDVGWVCMMYDPASWSAPRRPDLAWTPAPEILVERYCAAAGEHVDVRWYRALAGYRLAALTAHYLRLHVTGRRPDDVWPGMGESVPAMLARAGELLGPRR